MTRLSFALAAAAFIPVLAGCQSAERETDGALRVNGDGMLKPNPANGTQVTALRSPGMELAGTRWIVGGIDSVEVVSGSAPEILFTDEGQVTGTAGCNRFSASYVQDGAKVTVTGTRSTRMACLEDAVMAQEAAFLAILRGEADVLFSQPSPDAPGQLVLKGPEGLSFTGTQILPEPAGHTPGADPALLTGAAWGAESINAARVIGASGLTLVFGDDGRVSGSTGCNRISGLYDADHATITFTPLTATRRACPGEALTVQERAYLGALGGAMAWTITDDGALELTGGNGQQVVLRR